MITGMDDALLAGFADGVRDRVGPNAEGTIWALFLDAQHRQLLATRVEDGMAGLYTERLQSLAYLVGNVGAHAVVLAVPRRDGRPTSDDREFWRRLRVLMVCEPAELLDVLVVGDDTFWSAEREDRERGAVA
jgi:DNA repair protein RadC